MLSKFVLSYCDTKCSVSSLLIIKRLFNFHFFFVVLRYNRNSLMQPHV